MDVLEAGMCIDIASEHAWAGLGKCGRGAGQQQNDNDRAHERESSSDSVHVSSVAGG
jgi:hypothetical protein